MLKEMDSLREIGAHKICDDTHIALKHVQSIIHESFEDLDKIQFLGFVSILEREYKKDLSSLRKKGLEYFASEHLEERINHEVFVTQKRNMAVVYIFIALAIFVVAIYYSFRFTVQKNRHEPIDNSAIESATKNLSKPKKVIEIIVDKNVTDINSSDKNISKIQIKTILKPVKHKQVAEKKLSPIFIIPMSRLWIGYINKTDNIKKQTVIKNKLELNPNKEWLLSLGHGFVDINLNGKLISSRSAKNLRFRYKDGKLEKLSSKEFKRLNKGRLW